MRHPVVLVISFCVMCVGAFVACHDGSSTPERCPIINGVVVGRPGIDVLVRDVSGRGQAIGATVVARRGTDSTTVVGQNDTLHIYSDYNQTGTFTVRVSKPSYRDTIVQNVVVVDKTQCGTLLVTTQVPVTLRLASSAQRVRSMALLGAAYLWSPGAQIRLAPHIDAAPGVSTAVRWRISDPALARIDSAGVVTALCSRSGGGETVTAVSLADTTIQARAEFGVQATPTCP